jgi:hypothetical protein
MALTKLILFDLFVNLLCLLCCNDRTLLHSGEAWGSLLMETIHLSDAAAAHLKDPSAASAARVLRQVSTWRSIWPCTSSTCEGRLWLQLGMTAYPCGAEITLLAALSGSQRMGNTRVVHHWGAQLMCGLQMH